MIEIIKNTLQGLREDEEVYISVEVIKHGKTKLNKVSIRLINDAPLVSDEQLDTPKKAAKIVGDFIRNMDREVLCVVNFNSKLQPINFNVVSVGTVNQSLAVPRDILKSAILSNATKHNDSA